MGPGIDKERLLNRGRGYSLSLAPFWSVAENAPQKTDKDRVKARGQRRIRQGKAAVVKGGAKDG